MDSGGNQHCDRWTSDKDTGEIIMTSIPFDDGVQKCITCIRIVYDVSYSRKAFHRGMHCLIKVLMYNLI